jgi:ribosomal protein S18 acetylase RimI-like enzyme
MNAAADDTTTKTTGAAAERISIRALRPEDLDAVLAIDAAAQGQPRREYIERRLRAAQRDPDLHAQFGAVAGAGGRGALVGHMLARLLVGEFGLDRPALRLEMLGVREAWRQRGIGHALFEALAVWARRHGVAEIRTAALWRDAPLLAWFAEQGFELAPDQFVEVAVSEATVDVDEGADADMPPDGRVEIDYGRPEGNDHERLARDRADVRSMTHADLDAIVRIDRALTGRDRREYMAARLAEALDDAAVRISLAAHAEGTVVGYLMARADLGDFGRTAPVAVMDTLGVAPEYEHHGIGHALLSQLMANLGALRVERVETIVPQHNLALLGFLYSAGFKPAQRLSFVRRLLPA